ncbi:MAG: hypothetical protein AAFW46_05260 [Pseudomonadota bacterium]
MALEDAQPLRRRLCRLRGGRHLRGDDVPSSIRKGRDRFFFAVALVDRVAAFVDRASEARRKRARFGQGNVRRGAEPEIALPAIDLHPADPSPRAILADMEVKAVPVAVSSWAKTLNVGGFQSMDRSSLTETAHPHWLDPTFLCPILRPSLTFHCGATRGNALERSGDCVAVSF